jgi:hypothetical protein
MSEDRAGFAMIVTAIATPTIFDCRVHDQVRSVLVVPVCEDLHDLLLQFHRLVFDRAPVHQF